MNSKKAFALLTLLVLYGCSMHQNRDPIKNENFIVITTHKSDSFASLAKEYLDQETKAELIMRLNPNIQLGNGQRIAIPLKNMNRSAVFHNGYQSIPVLCYHQFTGDFVGRTKMVVPANEFESQMAYLYENSYNVINLEQLNDFLSGDIALPKNTVAITIDDGYKSFYDVAFPILQKYDFEATVFVYPDFVGGRLALSWKEIKELKNSPLIHIESHSKTHSNLSVKLRNESLAEYNSRLSIEVTGTERLLEQKLKSPIRFFAYPFGDTSEQLIELLEEQKYHLALTVERGENPTFSSPYQLKRNMVYGGQTMNEFKQSLTSFNEINFP